MNNKLEKDIRRKQLIIGKTVTTIGLKITDEGYSESEAITKVATEMKVPEDKARYWWSVYNAR